MGKNKKSSGQKDLRKRNSELVHEVQELRQRVEILTNQLAQIQRMVYGRRSEKTNPDQLAMFAQGDSIASGEKDEESQEDQSPDLEEEDAPSKQKKRYRRHHPGRHPLPDHLERTEIHLHPDNQTCECCRAELAPAGEEVSEVLAKRTQFYVKRFIRHKYACRHCEESIVRPDLPETAISKCQVGSGILAQIIVGKYQDHLPLYRQEGIFSRDGITIKRQTMCGWMSKCFYSLKPIVEQMAQEMLSGSFIQSDDTGLKYLSSPGPAEKGYLWSYVTGDMVVYDFTIDRSRAGPAKFLSRFNGTLQVDGYESYNEAVENGGLTRAACWAHVRRKFEQSLETEKVMAAKVLQKIQVLYKIEKFMRKKRPGWSAEQKAAFRRKYASPKIKALKKYLIKCRQEVLPKSPMGQAIEYAFGQWKWLKTYTGDGLVDIDNNSCERSMRKVAVGRKNYMFAGGEAGGHTAAVFYSLIETCSRLGTNPQEYLEDILVRVNTHPQSRIAELTPHGWTAIKKSEEKLSA